MQKAKIAVVLSVIISTTIVFAALLSTSAMQGVVSHYKITDWLEMLALSAFLILACSWPWQKAFSLAAQPEGKTRAVVFSFMSVAIASFFYSPITHAPAEGIGYNIIFCIFAIWFSYPISKVFSA